MLVSNWHRQPNAWPTCVRRNSIISSAAALQQSQAYTRALTLDGLHIEVAANVASSTEAADALANGADGVGLRAPSFCSWIATPAPDEQE